MMSDNNERPDEAVGTGAPLPPPDPSVVTGSGSAADHDMRAFEASGDGAAETIVGVSFDGKLMSQEFLLAMNRLKQDGALDLRDAVVVVKDLDGKVKVTETIDPSPGRAAMSGALWTGLFGLFLGGPIGWLAGLGVGAGAGAVTAKVIDLGIPDEWVDWFKDAVSPGTSTVVILAAEIDMRALEREASRFPGAELLHATLPPATIDRLAEAFESS